MNIRDEFRKPEWIADWKIFVLFATISFAIAFGLRAMELPKWDNPAFMVDGEYIMGTHDAYYWLAGAKGVGSAVGNPMSSLIRVLGEMTGAQYGNIAFWLPAVFAGFTAVAAFAWGMLVGGPWVGLVAGVYATAAPSFYFRTRLTYYDTDVVTLLFPLLISVLIARWVSFGIRRSWFKSVADNGTFQPTLWDYLLAVFAGCFVSYGKTWHGDVLAFGFLVLFISTSLSLFCAEKHNRAVLLRGVLLYALAGFGGLVGCVVALLLIAGFKSSLIMQRKIFDNIFLYLSLLFIVILGSGAGQDVMATVIAKFGAYLKPVGRTGVLGTGPSYPGIAQSVIEAQNISFKGLFSLLTGSDLLGWMGLCGFVVVLIFRPASMLLAPFVLLIFASVYMGGRFAMFGGIGLGVGLMFTIQQILIKIGLECKKQFVLNAIASVLLVVVLIGTYSRMYTGVAVTPILTQAHAKALIETGKNIPKDSTIWTWWDWGYASMYFTGVHSFANGGHHAGPVLYPLALAYASPSFLQANQMIKFSAANSNYPATVLSEMSAREAQGFINSFMTHKYEIKPSPRQYIVASWENIRLAYWIMFYGSWNLQTGMSVHPQLATIADPFELDFSTGVCTIRGQAPFQLRSYDFFEKGQRLSQVVSGAIGPHLLFNKVANSGFIVGDSIYSSMLLRLLVDDPNGPEISKYFRLVYEGYPSVRVYEVL